MHDVRRKYLTLRLVLAGYSSPAFEKLANVRMFKHTVAWKKQQEHINVNGSGKTNCKIPGSC